MPTTYAIPDGRTVMNAVARSGTGATATVAVGFQPDMIWSKCRSNAVDHNLFDSVRGFANDLFPNLTLAEDTTNVLAVTTSSTGYGFGSSNSINGSGRTYVDWVWKAGGTAVSNTAGSITSSVSANTTAGFSVVTYTGTGANATVGHGLGVAPSMIIIKERNTIRDWPVWHISIANTQYLSLNATDAVQTAATQWNSTTPTSTVFSIGTSGGVNQSTGTYVAYCFAPVAGYSNAFSYTGNGSTDGPFQYLGFRPRWIMIKRSSSTGSWEILDTSRNPYNDTNLTLEADLSAAESTGAGGNWGFDILSNGFKIRGINSEINTSGQTYIGFAVAENPFKFANAR